jgi:type II secretory pathway pseudopilin PulG
MNAPIATPVKNSGLAIWSLVLGILGLVFLILCIGPLFAIPAVICGHLAYGRIKRSAGAIGGEGLALTGLILGYVGIALGIVVAFLAAIAIPNFVKARDTAQKNICVNNLRVINNAKQQWALENHKTGDDTPTPEDLNPYISGGYARLRCPKDGEYTIGKVSEPPTCSIPSHTLDYRPSRLSPYRQANPRVSPSARTNLMMANPQLREAFQRNKCLNNLRVIDSAKRIWVIRYHKQTGDVPTADDIAPYLPGRQMPACPGGGTYEIGPVGEDPTCSIADHQLHKTP